MFRPKFGLLLWQVGLDPQGTPYNGVYGGGGVRPKGLANRLQVYERVEFSLVALR